MRIFAKIRQILAKNCQNFETLLCATEKELEVFLLCAMYIHIDLQNRIGPNEKRTLLFFVMVTHLPGF